MMPCGHRFRRDHPPDDGDACGSPQVMVSKFRCTRPGCGKKKAVRRNTGDKSIRIYIYR
ncbi:MAG: hypothetical protein MPK62_02290 [Alphaproteobacteria bacterium]|nr:hypothetical protein [Alphaproteobacteria bacterium]